jgi:DNA-binding SARP family transcriptional activator
MRIVNPKQGTPLLPRLFGPFDASVHGEPMRPLRSRRGYWLFSILALRAGRHIDRSWLAGTLWPESTEQQALSNLRRTLADLRASLGPEAFRVSNGAGRTLKLNLSGCWADLPQFDALIAAGTEASLQTAVSLYRGPLLEGWLEDWACSEREARRQAYLAALETLASRTLNAGRLPEAARLLRLAIAADPLGQSACRTLMQTLAQTGEAAAAALVYRDLRLRLHRELNVHPDPETVRVFEAIQNLV